MCLVCVVTLVEVSGQRIHCFATFVYKPLNESSISFFCSSFWCMGRKGKHRLHTGIIDHAQHKSSYFISYCITQVTYILTYLLTYLFTYLVTNLPVLDYLLYQLLTYSLTHLVAYIFTFLLSCTLTYSHSYYCTHCCIDLFTYLFTYLLTFLFTFLLAYVSLFAKYSEWQQRRFVQRSNPLPSSSSHSYNAPIPFHLFLLIRTTLQSPSIFFF